ncbi:MAG TPA: hypothetical protein VIV40_06170, partial [Kofleriaceae bacterium]
DDDDDDDDYSSAAPNRASTDMRTGKNPLAGHAIGEATKVGLAAAPPAPALLPEAALAFERDQGEHTFKGPPPQPDDLMKTIEQNPKTPIPTLDRIVRPGEGERPAQVPLSTAPTSLPPPKQLEAVPSGPTPACPQCESPMSWVDEHLRFYCRQCRMYF